MLHDDKLLEISSQKYPFHFSAYFGHGLYLFGREAGQFIGYTLIHFLIVFLLWAYSKEAAICSLLFLPFFLSGFYIAAHAIDQDEELPFSRFFMGYIHAVPLLVIGGSIMILCGVLALPFFRIDPIRELALMGFPRFLTAVYRTFGTYPLLIPSVFLYSFFRWAPMLHLFYNLSISKSLFMSFKLVLRRWLVQFIFTLVLVIIGIHFSQYFYFILSLLLVGVAACVDYASFAQVTELNQDETEPELVLLIESPENTFPNRELEAASGNLDSQATAASIPPTPKMAPKRVEEEDYKPWDLPDEKELKEKFERLFSQKPRFEFKNILPKALRLFSADMGNFLPYTILVIVLLLLLRLVGPVGYILNLFLANQLIAGYHTAGASLELGQKRGMASYFGAFEFVQPIGLFSLVQFLVNFILFLPFLFVVGFNMFHLYSFGGSAFPAWSLLLLLPLFYLNIAWRWAPALMIFYHMELWPALETSRKLVTRSFFAQLIHLFLLSIPFLMIIFISMVPIQIEIRLLVIFASLLLLGYSFGADYCAFAEAADLFDQFEEEKMDILDHFIEGKDL